MQAYPVKLPLSTSLPLLAWKERMGKTTKLSVAVFEDTFRTCRAIAIAKGFMHGGLYNKWSECRKALLSVGKICKAWRWKAEQCLFSKLFHAY